VNFYDARRMEGALTRPTPKSQSAQRKMPREV